MTLRPDALILILLLGGGPAGQAPADSPPADDSRRQQAWRYRVSDDHFSWEVHQGSKFTVVRTAESADQSGGEVVLVAGPGPGRHPAARVRNVPILARVLGGPDSLGRGHISRSTFGETAVLDSLRFALRPGGDPIVIGGHATTHRVLVVEAWWIEHGEDGSRTPVREAGRADLWFAADLPFSLVPLSMPPPPGASGAALPLSFYHPEVAAHVLERVIGELEPLGLLLRARVVDSVVPEENPKAAMQLARGAVERSITVDSIRTAPDEPSAPEWTGLPLVSASQAIAIEIGLVSVGQVCEDERTGGAFEFYTRGPVGYMGSGSGAILLDREEKRGPEVVLRGGNQNVVECTLVMFSDSVGAPGTYRVVAPSPTSFTGSEPRAVVVHLLVEPATRVLSRFLVLEKGEVRLERSDASGATGVIRGAGWVVELDPRHRTRLVEDLEFEASFRAVPEPADVERE